MKIIAVYKITNTITGNFYIGSSKNVKQRWAVHKCKSKWNEQPNNPMYQDMQKYGVDKFAFEILEVVEVEKLKEKEQEFIELLNPTYNNYNAKGLNIGRRKEYEKSDKRKEYKKEYEKSDKRKEYKKEYEKTERYKEYQKDYNNQLCLYNGETLTLHALRCRFSRAGIEHPVLEAKKYLLNESKDNIKE